MIKKYMLCSLFFLSTVGHADSKLDWLLYGGVYGITQGVQQHIDIQNMIGNEYVPKSRSDGNALVGFGVFRDVYSMEKATIQAGFQLYYLFSSHVAGQVLLENAFNDVNYQYSMSYLPIYAALKLHKPSHYDKLDFVFDAGVGADFIRMNRYHETAVIPGTVPDDAYQAREDTSITATVGVAARVYRFPHDGWVELGYRFFYLGDAKFNPSNSLYLTSFRAGSMYGNAFVLALHVD